MQDLFKDLILSSTGAKAILKSETIQGLWSGYGEINRLHLDGPSPRVIVKQIELKPKSDHPRGWSGEIGHLRKLRSYRIENNWYKKYANHSQARLPHYYGSAEEGAQLCLVLEDLDAAGYHQRRSNLEWPELKACIEWLAVFHASFLGTTAEGLWEQGCYWHLKTRPQEWEALPEGPLKRSAAAIDQKLEACRYKTIVHGDAKLANFCFSPSGAVAAVDFQYVGRGCGMKDLAYFLGSCLDENDCEQHEKEILDYYFTALEKALGQSHPELESDWRPLYRVAWADFHRFLKGWSPEHWKINSYSERICNEVIKDLQ